MVMPYQDISSSTVTQPDEDPALLVAGGAIIPVIEASDPTPAEDLAIPPVEELASPVVVDPITTPTIP